MITIPGTTFQTSQKGEKSGNIIRTRNIDLSQDGTITLARKAMSLFAYGATGSGNDAIDPAFQGNVQAIISDTTYAYIATGAGMFVQLLTDILETAVQIPNNGSHPTFGFDTDMVWFQGKPHISGGQYVSSLNTGISSFASRVISGLDTTAPHPLCNRERAATLLVGNGNVVRQYSSAYVRDTANELTIPEQYIVTSIRTNGNYVYVGTRHKYGGEARLFLWNGVGIANQADYPCGADWIYSMAVYKSSITIVTSDGSIGRFNGGGFDRLAAFPVYYTPYSWASTNPASYLIGRVASRGMAVIGDSLFINIDGAINNSIGVYPGTNLPEQPSGLWEYSPTVGLFHKGSVNLTPRLRMSPTEINSFYLKFPTAHGAATGDPVMAAVSGITGLTNGQVYYAVMDSGSGATTLRLALSPADALAGRYIPIGGTPTADSFVFERYATVGNTVVSYPGAVFAFGATKPSVFYGSEVLYGSSIYDSTNLVYAASIMSLGMGRNVGSFILPKIFSPNIKDSFQRFASFFEHLYLSTDQIIVKYRTLKRIGLPTPLAFSPAANWTSTTTFTVDTTLKDFKSVQVGDEIEVVSGANAGYTAHITAIDTSTNVYSVSIDETMPVGTGAFDFIADNWTKLTNINTDSRSAFEGLDETSFDNSVGKWIEVKVEMRGRGVSIDQMQLVNSAHTISK